MSPIEEELDKLAAELESAAYRIAKQSSRIQEDPALLLLTMLQVLQLNRQIVLMMKEKT